MMDVVAQYEPAAHSAALVVPAGQYCPTVHVAMLVVVAQ
jgi:hypothetical protein